MGPIKMDCYAKRYYYWTHNLKSLFYTSSAFVYRIGKRLQAFGTDSHKEKSEFLWQMWQSKKWKYWNTETDGSGSICVTHTGQITMGATHCY